jgi:hypothetical protein
MRKCKLKQKDMLTRAAATTMLSLRLSQVTVIRLSLTPTNALINVQIIWKLLASLLSNKDVEN